MHMCLHMGSKPNRFKIFPYILSYKSKKKKMIYYYKINYSLSSDPFFS